jgi:hypothetical protein
MAGRDWSGTGLGVLGPTDFESHRLKRPGRYAVCFGATWCPWTRGFVREFQTWQEGAIARLFIADLTDRNSPLWDTFGIRITPSVLCYVDGEIEMRLDGRRIIGISRRDRERLTEFLRRGTASP